MKKILFAIMALAAITFTTSCDGTGKTNTPNDSVNADSIVTEAPVAPEANVDAMISSLSTALAENDVEATQTFLQKAQAYIAKLQEEGKIEEAKAYIAKLQQFIKDNEEKISQFTANNKTLSNIVSAVKAIPVDVTNAAADAAESAKNAATDAANNAVESGKKEAGKAIDNAASAAKNALGI